MIGEFVLANLSVRSAQVVFIFDIQNMISTIRLFQKDFFSILQTITVDDANTVWQAQVWVNTSWSQRQ